MSNEWVKPPHYCSRYLDVDSDFRRCLWFINTYTGGKTHGSCAGHPPNTYEKSNKKLYPLINVGFIGAEKFDNAKGLLDLFLNKGWVRAYLIDIDNFKIRKYPDIILLTIHFKYEVKDIWSVVLKTLEESIEESR